MLVDFRPHAKLLGKNPVDLATSVTPVLEALAEHGSGQAPADLSQVLITCDWVQYAENFRDVIDVRPILVAQEGIKGSGGPLVPAGSPAYHREIAVDVRRSGRVPLKALAAARLLADADPGVFLEDWCPGSASLIWEFNALYWAALELWEQAAGRGYEQALPGGTSDARNREAAHDLIGELFGLWDELAAARCLPAELYVAELGVGNGNQAKVFLDEFRALDQVHGQGYYLRLRYLLCDYSQHVLDQAARTVAEHASQVSSVWLDATRAQAALGSLRGSVFLLYMSNVYDNLPTDEVAKLGGQSYQVQVRACFPRAVAADLAASVSADPEQLPSLVRTLLRLGPVALPGASPDHFGSVDDAVTFWRRAWSALRLAERYVPLAGLDLYQIAPDASGELLRPLLESGPDIRMHVSNGALASFADSLELLHPRGKLVCHDLFVTRAQDYRTGFRGPGKYDGSVVNWLNGPLLAHVGRQRGFDVRYEPFRHRSGGNIVTMTARRCR